MLSATLALIAVFGNAAGGAEARRPNIIIILADDLGWGELGFQGNRQIPTPHTDSITANGVRFPQGYIAATYCSPSRAGLLTGRYPTRFGHEFNSVARQSGLALGETTLANRLKDLGYATCAIGKWHLGEKPAYRPTRRGFDEFYGTLANTPYYHPTNFVDSRISDEVRPVTDPDFYTIDMYCKRAVEWIERHKDGPFFLYLPFNSQHAPLQAPKKYLDRFASIEDETRRTFAAILSATDDAIGQVLGKVRAIGQEENTLIFYFADNGGPTRQTTSSNGPLRGFKATTWEGGIRIPFAAQWKGKIPAGQTFEHPIIQLDIFPTVIAAAGGTIQPEWKLDGVNLLPFLGGSASGRPHQTLYWRFGDQWAIRDGDWKLLVANGGGKKPELYHLKEDLGETRNRAADQPEKVKELLAKWQTWNAQQAPPSSPKENLQPPRQGRPRKKAAAN